MANLNNTQGIPLSDKEQAEHDDIFRRMDSGDYDDKNEKGN